MDSYDVIIIGTGAGGGTLARHLAPSGKRILLLERGDWLPREPQNWSDQDVFVDNRYVSPDTWYDASGKPFQPRVHYFVGGATKMYGAALYRLRKEDFGELQPPRRHLARLADLLRRAGAVLHAGRAALPGARRARRGPDRAARERAVSASRPSRTSRGSSSSHDDLAAAGLPPVPRAVRDHARRVEHAVQHLHPLRELRRLPVPRPRQVGRRGARRAAGARAPQRHAADEREGRQARDERRRARPSPRSSSSATAAEERYAGDDRRRRLRRRQHGEAAARVGERQAPERPRQRLRPGRPQLHVPRQHGRARALARGEPDRLPEDARAERLLLRQRRLRLPAREHPDGRQVAGADVPRRASRARRSSRPTGRSSGWRATRSTSGSRPRTCRGPRTASPSSRTASITLDLHGDERGAEEAALREGQVDAREARHEPGPPHPPLRLHEERHPRRRLRAPGRHLPLRHRPGDVGARRRTARRTSSTTSTSSTRASSRASAPSIRR